MSCRIHGACARLVCIHSPCMTCLLNCFSIVYGTGPVLCIYVCTFCLIFCGQRFLHSDDDHGYSIFCTCNHSGSPHNVMHSTSNIGFHGIISTPLHWVADTRTAILCKLHECYTHICVCVGGWDTNQLTGINSPHTSAWETDNCWYAKVEWRRAPGGYKKKKLATKLPSSWHKYQSSNTTKWSARCSSWPSQPS